MKNLPPILPIISVLCTVGHDSLLLKNVQRLAEGIVKDLGCDTGNVAVLIYRFD